MRLDNKVALVTGGGVGIGKAISIAFAREGADLVIASPFPAELEPTAKEIKSMGRQCLAVVTDITDEKQVRNMVVETVKKYGRIDILVNNSGISGKTANVIDVDIEDWNKTLTLNLTGSLLCAKEALKVMIPRKSGNVLNISSVSGKRGFAMRSPYTASKWGLVGLTQTWALEVGKHNIRVNCICPGPCQGERIERVMRANALAKGLTYEAILADATKGAALNRMVTPEEVAAVAVFLASDEASGMTGQAINVTAGLEMK
ncbi:MAG: SDR family NAD(P)-dependent oxidoreductase [Chloroflexota bacterium]